MNKNNIIHKHSDQRGSLIILSMIVIFAMSSIGLSIAQTVLSQYGTNKQRLFAENAIGAAEAGVSATRQQLATNSGFTGWADTNRQVLYNDANRGKADYSTTVTDNPDGTKTVTSTGYAYRPGDVNAYNTKRIKAVVRATTKTITTPSVYAGNGGLYISNGGIGPNNNGNVMNVLGKLYMSNHGWIGAAALGVIAGTPTLNVANIGCGTAAAYPIPCPTNQQPLVLSGYSRIYANVCATNQVNATMGMFGDDGVFAPGALQPNCTAPVSAMPIFDKQAHVNRMSVNGGNTGNCFTGSRTWTANTTYTGNVEASLYCNVTVAGDVYITGNLKIDGFSSLAPQAGLTTPPTIVVNGQVTLGSANINVNAQGVGVRIISFHSNTSSCSTSPNCTSLSSANALASANTNAIYCQFCRPDGSILWSYFGRTSLNGGTGIILGQPVVGVGAIMGASVVLDGFGYSGSSTHWMTAPPGTVTIPSGYELVDYQQVY